MKKISVFLFILLFAISCNKNVDNLSELDNVSAPANVNATFDVTQDNSGLVTIYPTAEGVTQYKITFGDVLDETPTVYGLNESITHVYTEGVYTVGITAVGITGLTASVDKDINITFKAPENLVVTIEQDATNPKIISVSAYADYATIMDIYFGDVPDEEPAHALPDEVVQHTYAEAGDYVIKVVAKSAGAETTEYSETITITAASDPVLLPITFESFTVNYAFTDFGSVTSSVIDNPDISGINQSSRVAQSVKPTGAEVWGGSFLTLGNPIDFSAKKVFKVKTWSPKSGATVKLKVENLDNSDIAMEVDALTTVSNEWEELTFNFSAIDVNNTYQKIVIFFDFGNPGDGSVYYFDDIKQVTGSASPGIAGTWKVAPVAGSLGVGPAQGDISWWSIDEAGVILRDCYFDDRYVFGADGSFTNVLEAETWIEGWQGGSDACGTPVAPHDGSNPATYTYDASAGTVTLNGTGSYLGIPKAYNGGELTTPDDAPPSITYLITFSDDDSEMTVDINIGGGWWRFILVRDGAVAPSPLEGTWQVAPIAGSLGVGPALGDISWWSIDEAGVLLRDCFYDDLYVFGADGSFSNVLESESWIEGWQGGSDACGTPVAPHDGSIPATYSFDEGAGTVTLNGTGSYLGIPKAYNGGELTTPDDAPPSITYLITLSDDNSEMTLDIDIGGGWWRFILVKN
ncbi:MAG TPA: hypothetical protein VIN10_12405 [Bacteroidales bacterium]